jgi:hypothetical protein
MWWIGPPWWEVNGDPDSMNGDDADVANVFGFDDEDFLDEDDDSDEEGDEDE